MLYVDVIKAINLSVRLIIPESVNIPNIIYLKFD